MSEGFKPIETQEAFDEMIKDRLRRAEEKIRSEFSDYKDLKTKVEDYEKKLSENEKKLSEYEPIVEQSEEKSKGFESTIGELNRRVKESEMSALRMKTAYDMGIPLDLCDRIKGDTENDIKKDAESLARFIGSQNPPAPPLADPEINNRNVSEEAAAMKTLINGLVPEKG